MEYILSLTFVCENGEKSTLTITNVKDSITSESANTLMDTIIAGNVFNTKNGKFVSKSSAQLTERKITKYTVA